MKTSNNILLLLLLFITNSFFAQQIKFRRVIGNTGYDYGNSAVQTKDGGYIIGGTTSSFGAGSTDMYVVKTDAWGIPTKQVTIGGINVEAGNCIRQTTDKGYIIVGYTNSYGAGGYDVYLVKLDSNLNQQWSKTYGGTDWDFGKCVEQTFDGGYIICGGTYSFGHGNEDYFLIKTTATGDTSWTKTYGGTNEDIANSVIQTRDGGYILTGTTKSMGDTLGDFYTIKTDWHGDTTWANKFGGNQLDYGNDILESIYGGYMVAGETQSYGLGSLNNSDGIIVRLSYSGHVDSTKITGLPGYDNIESITEDNLGRIAMTGITQPSGVSSGTGDISFFVIKNNWLYYNGTTFGASDYEIGYSIETTEDDGFIICGYTNSFNNYLPDIYLIKIDSLGNGGTVDNTIATGIQSLSTASSSIKIYPNPANNTVIIHSDDKNEPAVIQIFDIIGKEIISEKTNKQFPYSIDISALVNGLYILNVTTKSHSFSQKLIVQH